jgi:hypothetical protein
MHRITVDEQIRVIGYGVSGMSDTDRYTFRPEGDSQWRLTAITPGDTHASMYIQLRKRRHPNTTDTDHMYAL